MIIEDVLMAGLLAIGLGATWGMVISPVTVVPLHSSLAKLGSSTGLGLLQASLDLWLTATVSAAYSLAFLLLALLRRPQPTGGIA